MVRILIADDHPVVRRGVADILAGEFQDVMYGEAVNGQQTTDEVARQDWDLVILDLKMPGRSGLESLKELKRMRPKLPVLVLSFHAESQYGMRSLLAGADGYVNKESAPEDLVRSVRQILAGRRYVSPALAELLAGRLGEDPTLSPHENLSDREIEILILLGSGKTTKRIAMELNLSQATISTYRSRIMEKMNLKTTAELIHYALANHLAE